ncbi:ubiquinol-cytochrome c reductase iron-sulfur subunit [bacterium]|nr:ubiquinol-cytochrome c reductase iron-sulfur subunit [bacterium]
MAASKSPTAANTAHSADQTDGKRRDFLVLTATAMGGLAAATAAWPLIDSLNPSQDVLAMASTEVDISKVAEGQSIRVMWRGKPVFIRHRTAKEIEEARAVNLGELRDPQQDSDRVKPGKEAWLVLVGVCTHLGCVPIGESGDFGGWLCPCHGSHYDTSGRIRKGPAPANLAVPEYAFLNDTKIKIG